MKNPQNLLIVAASDHDANMLYATGMFVPDPFIFLRIRSRCTVVMSDLEIDRARKQAPHCRALSLSLYQRKLRSEGVKNTSLAHIIPLLLSSLRGSSVLCPIDFTRD